MKMQAPEGATGVSHDGVNYEVVNGVITVPHDAQSSLESFGYTPILEGSEDAADVAVEAAVVEKRRGRPSKAELAARLVADQQIEAAAADQVAADQAALASE